MVKLKRGTKVKVVQYPMYHPALAQRVNGKPFYYIGDTGVVVEGFSGSTVVKLNIQHSPCWLIPNAHLEVVT